MKRHREPIRPEQDSQLHSNIRILCCVERNSASTWFCFHYKKNSVMELVQTDLNCIRICPQ